MPALANAQRPVDEVSAWMFFRSLRSSRLLPLEEVELLEREVGDQPLVRIQDLLLETGTLNKYQLDRLMKGEAEGLVFGQYHILGELGQGGCGQVFKARHALMDRIVALKIIGPDIVRSKHARDIFLREVIACTRLSHPHIATAYDADEVNGQLYFVMEYVDGTTLHSYVQAGGPLPITLACTILLESALAIQHAHEKGLVHRDIKPANIILYVDPNSEANGKPPPLHVKLVDFGLARVAEISSQMLKTLPCREGGFIGTPAFIAPEQIKDSHTADIRSDLYSLGCTLYYALAGRPPFEGINTDITLYQQAEEEPTPLLAHRPSIPQALARLVHRLMAKNPAQRYQTPSELIDALNGLILSGEIRDRDSVAVANPPRSLAQPQSPQSTPNVHVVLEGIDVQTPLPVRAIVEEPAAAYDVRELWLDWLATVEDIARGVTPAISDSQYKSLYRQLLAGIKQERKSGALLSPAHCDRLHNLVEPWVMLASFARLEPRMLGDIARDCQDATDICWPEAIPKVNLPRIPAILLCVAGFIAAILLLIKIR